MTLKIAPRERDGITILDFEGDLVSPLDTQAVSKAIEKTCPKNRHCSMIFNFESLDQISRHGIEFMRTLRMESTAQRQAIKLLNVTNVANADPLPWTAGFEVFEDENAAIDSFFPGFSPPSPGR